MEAGNLIRIVRKPTDDPRAQETGRMLSEGDLVEYHIPPGGYGYSDRVGMLGLVVKMGTPALPNADLNTSDLCQVLWGRFAGDGPQWYKIKHLRRAG